MLAKFEWRRNTVADARLGDREDRFGEFKIEASDLQPLAQRQQLKIGIGRPRNGGKRNGCTVRTACHLTGLGGP